MNLGMPSTKLFSTGGKGDNSGTRQKSWEESSVFLIGDNFR